MLPLTSTLLAGLVATAVALGLDDPRRLFQDDSGPSPALDAAHREFAVLDAAIARRSEQGTDVLEPLTIPVKVFTIASSSDKLLGHAALKQQLHVMKKSFASVNVAFALKGIKQIVDPVWAKGDDELNMLWDNHNGDARMLHLYFIEGFERRPKETDRVYSLANMRNKDPYAHRRDGVIVSSWAVPGAGPRSSQWEGKAAVKAIGGWLGLRDAYQEDCNDHGVGVIDVPIALNNASVGCPEAVDSCPGQPGVDAIHNFMSGTDESCRSEFTPGQGRRIRQLWDKFRAHYRLPSGPLLPPLEPINKTSTGKLPYYPWPLSKLAALTQCNPDRFNVTREYREERCGTFTWCYFGIQGAWAKAGASYGGEVPWWTCMDGREEDPSMS